MGCELMETFKSVKSIESLISFLKKKGGNHNNYYHYTTWDSLSKIISNKTFLLTRGNSLSINDQNEAHMKGSWSEWNKIYIGSFAFGSAENMAMWGLYGLPWQDAVRISIPKNSMKKWVNEIEQISLFDNEEMIAYNEGFDISLNDIVYVDGVKGSNNLRLTHCGDTITVSNTYPLYGVDVSCEMTGYIKNYAWHYENEVRMRIRLNHDTGFERISIPIPKDIVDSFTITTGPYFKWKNDRLYKQLMDEGKVDESGFENLVKYKILCDYCKHKTFVRKA